MRKIYLLFLVALLAMPASATVHYVDANRSDNAGDGLTWATAHKYLQTALTAAVDGDQIWVAQGTYKPTTSTTDRTASFVMKEGVAIYGGFTSGQMSLNDRNTDPATNGTILSSDIDGDGTAQGNSLHIIYNIGNLTPKALLDGFTLNGGNSFYNSTNGSESGGAMYFESASPLINRCLFQFNNAGTGGAILGKSSSVQISNCTFFGNSAATAGAISISDGNPIITDCVFKYNNSLYYDGGAIQLSGTGLQTEVIRCKFEQNQSFYSGGAIYKNGGSLKLKNSSFEANSTRYSQAIAGGAVSNSGSIRIENCQFTNNSTGGDGGALFTTGNDSEIVNSTFKNNTSLFAGGGIYNRGNMLIWNSLFQNNSSTSGGAFYNRGTASFGENIPQFINCSFLGNSASAPQNNTENGGGAIYNFGKGSPQFTNCVLWNNGGANTFNDGGISSVVPTISYTLLDASVTRFGGIGPITYIQVNQSPFVSDSDARLRSGSPAIDAGLNSANSTTTDLAGNQRVVNSTIDMGAYEFIDPASFAITGLRGVNCQEVSATARQLTFTPIYTGTDGSPITFSVYGEMVETTEPGPYSIRLYKDNPVITMIAKQENGAQFNYRYDWLATCGTTPPPVEEFAIIGVSGVNCQTVSPTARQLTFTPTYQGSDGTPITFSVYGEMVETQSPGPYSLRLYIDNPTITLIAKQGANNPVTFQYNWLNVCNASAVRLAADEEFNSTLQVRVLGNPVSNGELKLEVTGAQRQPLAIQLMDINGRLVEERHVKQAEAIESHSIGLGQRATGLLFLRVNTPSQSRTIKVLNMR